MAIWLDVTTILRWPFRPVGIIRVESELVREWLQRAPWRFRFCRFDSDRRCFVVVSSDELRALPAFRSVRRGGAQRWFAALVRWRGRVRASLQRWLGRKLPVGAAMEAVPFTGRDTYLSVGLDWDDKDGDVLREWKRRHGFRVVLCCYDLIPLLLPALTLASTRERFPAYLRALVANADAVLCISRSTRSDLQAFLRAEALPQPALSVIRLGADLPVHDEASLRPQERVRQESQQGPFILMVSTLEARKGHDVLVRAYRRLLSPSAGAETQSVHDASGASGVPRLLLAGSKGWGVEELLHQIETDPLVAGRIAILSDLEDGDLAWLYRHCLFTVFPSLYEGWGLPVAESLARGKFCLCSDRASLPEVGGAFCEYLPVEDERLWAERILYYARDPQALAARETRIRRDFRPFSWRQTCDDVLAVVNGC